jgi:hypothetical protein
MDPIPADPALPPLPSPKPASHSPASTKYSVRSPTPEDTGHPRTSKPLFLPSPPEPDVNYPTPDPGFRSPTPNHAVRSPTPEPELAVHQAAPERAVPSLHPEPNVLSSSPKHHTRGRPRKQKVRKVTLLVTGPPAADPCAQESNALEEEEEDELQSEDSAADGPPLVSP